MGRSSNKIGLKMVKKLSRPIDCIEVGLRALITSFAYISVRLFV